MKELGICASLLFCGNYDNFFQDIVMKIFQINSIYLNLLLFLAKL